MPAPAVLAVLLDAMDQELARGLAAEGVMPALAGLLRRGAVARVENPAGFYAGGLWPSFFTARNPGRHGEYCWRQFDPATYVETEPVFGAGSGEPFWRTLDRAGRRVLVLDVPRSALVPLEHGVAVHDFVLHDPLGRETLSSPPDVAPELVARLRPPRLGLCEQWPRRSDADVRAFEERLGTNVALKERALAALVSERGPFDVVLVGLAEAHCAGHQLWHLHDPAHRRHDARQAREVGDPVRRVYARLDAALARALSLAGEGTRVLVHLSHGMGPQYEGSHLLDRLLERLGTSLPGTRELTWRERLMRLRARARRPKRCGLRRLWRRWSSLRFRPAFTVGSNGAWAAIRLNVAGREAHGLIEPAQRDAAVARLQAMLVAARNPGTGAPAFTRVERSASICWGERVGLLPDLVAEWSRAGPFDALEIPGLGRIEGRSPAVRTGDHRPDGLAIVAGPGLPAGDLGRRVSVLDLAPTLCDWLDVPMDRPDGSPVPAWSLAAQPAR